MPWLENDVEIVYQLTRINNRCHPEENLYRTMCVCASIYQSLYLSIYLSIYMNEHTHRDIHVVTSLFLLSEVVKKHPKTSQGICGAEPSGLFGVKLGPAGSAFSSAVFS